MSGVRHVSTDRRRGSGIVRGAVFCGALGLFAALGGCDIPGPSAGSSGPAANAPTDGAGSISMQLSVGGHRFDSVSYDISGNGFHKADVIGTAASSGVSTLIGGIPVGSGYLVQLSARDVDQNLTPCVGSAPFDVPTATTVTVSVHLTCHEIVATTPPPQRVPAGGTAAALSLAGLLIGAGVSKLRRRRGA